MYALVDGNNFYVSCERMFNPRLEGKPVVVLSNNDGVVISRSNEAKALGIKMAEPVFKCKDLIEQNNVTVFSSNYTLYGDLSNRMMKLLATFTPEIEIYSIDEAFLNLDGLNVDFESYAQTIRNTVYRNIGIPVGVGIGPTKTLAKIANKIAKKNKGVFVIDSSEKREWALRNTPVEDVWGIGRQYSKLLNTCGVKTAYDFTQLGSDWIRRQMAVTGLRTREELLGNPCIPIESVVEAKKAIATTRSFSQRLTDIEIIAEAVATHAVRCAEKLRRQKTVAQYVTVFVLTDPFSKTERYLNLSTTLTLSVASNVSNEIAKVALMGLRKVFINGHRYKKAGVIVSGISPETYIQGNLFETNNIEHKALSKLSDALNQRYGRDMLKLAIQGSSPQWQLKHEKLSQRYTTRWDELLKVKASIK